MNDNKYSLMVVDDDAGICDLVVSVARECGFAAYSCQSPNAMWTSLAEFTPDVLVLDLNLPENDGVTLLGKLGEQNAAQKILLISGRDNRTLVSAERIGTQHGLDMVGSLQKPFPVEALESVFQGIVSAREPVHYDELSAGIDQGELVVQYQPKVSLGEKDSWLLHSAEALVRWQHPRYGLLGPDSFIPLAEETELITRLTCSVLADAIGHVAEWQCAGINSSVSVNLSPLLLGQQDLPDEVMTVLAEHDLPPQRLTFEITETAVMRDVALSQEILTRFRVKGIGLSIDDFGTGYSSLVHLHRMPFNELKIDKSFTLELGSNPEAEVIVRSIVGLGHNLGLKVCVEGVETAETMRHLADLGCDYFQGFHIARPGPPEAIANFLTPRTDGPDTERDSVR